MKKNEREVLSIRRNKYELLENKEMNSKRALGDTVKSSCIWNSINQAYNLKQVNASKEFQGFGPERKKEKRETLIGVSTERQETS